jgi:hypothetical protein
VADGGRAMLSDEELDGLISEFHFDETLLRLPEGEVRDHFRNVARNTLRHFHREDDATIAIK